jgi:hypothetical protein
MHTERPTAKQMATFYDFIGQGYLPQNYPIPRSVVDMSNLILNTY